MADLTITIPDAAVPRVRDAFEFVLGRPATIQDIKDYIIAELTMVIQSTEKDQAVLAAVDPTFVDFS